MEFIEGGASGRDNEANGEDTAGSFLTLTEGPDKKCSENRVFGEVGAFADNKLDRSHRCIRNIGSDPAQERTNEARGVLGRHQIARTDADEKHPEQDGQPVFQKSTHQKRNHNRGACANFAA